jgi:3-hydroxyacyl-CoA dehydrogenase
MVNGNAAPIRRVAVLGAGVMGTGIATHLANAGVDSLLFDMKKEGKDPSVLATTAIAAAQKSKPASLFRTADASRVKACNYDDHADLLATCDWIVEVVVERLDVKVKVFDWVAKNRKPGSIVSSNTSGIKLADMTAAMPEEMRRHFLVTHFFNPVRYMRLLELVVGPHTDPAVAARMADFGDRVLGKGIVWCKDTPNFIANRIGTYGMASVFRHMQEAKLSVAQVDAIFGTPMGRPASAVFRTADIVGLDTLVHVFENLHAALVSEGRDEERDIFRVPDEIRTLVAAKRTGEKVGEGFYKKVKGADGKSEILAFDFAKGEYVPQEKVRADSIGKAKKAETAAAKLKAMVYGADDAAKAAWRVTADTLIYAANRLPEIADDVVNVDRAMRWGFAWDLGPFESWDAIGVRESVAKMQAEGRAVPAWVTDMLASGRESFYARDGASSVAGDAARRRRPGAQVRRPDPARRPQGRRPRGGGAQRQRRPRRSRRRRVAPRVPQQDERARRRHLRDVRQGARQARRGRVRRPRGRQPGPEGVLRRREPADDPDGRDAGPVEDQMEGQIAALQNLVMRAKYSPRPVVTAPHQLTLGGGCEVSMHSAATVASGELYMGLVEAGVGLIPGAAAARSCWCATSASSRRTSTFDPNPFVQKAFERIGLAKVSTSAEEARDLGFLRPTDRVVTNPDRVLAEAKKTALGLAKSGLGAAPSSHGQGPRHHRQGRDRAVPVRDGPGQPRRRTTASSARLANVLCGGDVPWGTVRTEQDLLDLEREAFLSLAGTPATQARIQHMLQTGKPLRN